MTTVQASDERSGVVVFDFNWSGHIPAYHRFCVEAACRSVLRPVVSLSGQPAEIRDSVIREWPAAEHILQAPVCPELGRPPARDSYLRFLHRIPGGFQLWSRIRVHPRLRARHALRRWQACGSVLRRLPTPPPALVFFPYLDDMLEPSLRVEDIERALGGHPWAGILMEASDLRSRTLKRRITDRLHLLRAPTCMGVGVLDEAILPILSDALCGRTVTFIPDIAEASMPNVTPARVAEVRGRARNRKVVGLIGHLTEVKNLGLFLEIATDPAQKDLFFLIAGQFEPLGVNPRTRGLLEQAAAGRWDNIVALPGRIGSEADFNALVASTDVLFAVYRDFTRSSNMLSKAAQSGRPVLVADGYCMAERVRSYGLGASVAGSDPAVHAAALRALLAAPPSRVGFERYAQDFSREQFQKQLIALMRNATRLPPKSTPKCVVVGD
jgi:glycosyltransferase involved in cell wall biosynthesis